VGGQKKSGLCIPSDRRAPADERLQA